MSKVCAFTIYNASAGSGKTYTLVKDYLKILLKSKSPLAFKSILALTFTNKAVAEMKERIIKTLQEFAEDSILTESNSMFKSLCQELDIEPKLLHQKSKATLEMIVHNYASFDISTIDKFNHKLIRTFAYDLNLPMNFEVELDTANLLSKAVDKLIDKAGTDEDLTKILVDFAIEKADDDKSWDVSYDFNIIAKLLINENDIPYIATLKDKTLEDFKILKSQLIERLKKLETLIIEIASTVLNLIEAAGLVHNDFSGKDGLVPSYFLNLSKGEFDIKFDKVWMEKIESHPLYAATSVNKSLIPIIDGIQTVIASAFYDTKNHLSSYKFLKNVLKNITPLSVLNAIDNTLKELKDNDNLLLISEFNSLISNQIKNQPAPFIYERIGEKFKHYFVDEFQDTSVLQWENIIPLIDNALSSENLRGETGTAMIVGDAKQAIYRWRGGKAEQFIDLYTEGNSFSVEKRVENLPANYRSLRQIVNFNNSFFKYLSEFVFSNEQHQTIYQQSPQAATIEMDGYVELSFLDIKNMEECENKDVLHCQKVLETILKVQGFGFQLKDICVIVRKSKEGIAIAEYLSTQNIPIISSESLLLQNSPEVQFLNSIISLATQPTNDNLKIEVLNYLAENKLHLQDKHSFFSKLIQLEASELFKHLAEYGFYFNFNIFLHLSLYEAVETLVRQFRLNETSNAYLQYYLDEVFIYSQKYNASFLGFMAYWDTKKKKLSVISPQGNNAVQIITIHKSKGLEFPVVIFPYANQNIYFDISPKIWFPVEKKEFNGFSHLFLNMNKDLEEFGDLGATLYRNYRSELELDTINLLYVVLTRAIEHLYIISEFDMDSKQNEKPNLYSGLFIKYLKSINLWKDNQDTYELGSPSRQLQSMNKSISINQTQFISTPKEDHNLNIVTNSGFLWDTAQEKAQEKGNLVHHIMSQIKTTDDIEIVLEHFYSSGKLNFDQTKELKPIIHQIVSHINLSSFYKDGLTIYNEKDIITQYGEVWRPDRIVINGVKEAVIIDYKTGTEKPSHIQQLLSYQSILEEMGFKVMKKILIYINEDIQVKEF